MTDVVPQVEQDAFQDVVGQKGAEVADVCAVVDGGAARVHGYLGRGDGTERVFGSGQGVVEL